MPRWSCCKIGRLPHQNWSVTPAYAVVCAAVDGVVYKCVSLADCLWQGIALRYVRGYGRRECAACAVEVFGGNLLGTEFM